MAPGTSVASSDSSRTRPSVNAWYASRLLVSRMRAPRCRVRAHPERLGKLRHDAILQLEHLLERAVRLGFRERLAGGRIHDARGDAQAIAGRWKLPTTAQIEMQLRARAPPDRARPPHRFDDAHAIDDAVGSGRAQIVGDGFRDAGRQPRRTPDRR